jgi:hypothetical protein
MNKSEVYRLPMAQKCLVRSEEVKSVKKASSLLFTKETVKTVFTVIKDGGW